MTDQTPPAGKTWVTVEIDTDKWDTGEFEYEDVFDVVIGSVEGPDLSLPEDLFRLAEDKFRSVWLQTDHPSTTGRKLGEACATLADAIRATREAL